MYKICVFIFCLLIIGCGNGTGAPSITEGSDAPSFVLNDLNGQPVKSVDLLSDKPLVLDFWASWCPYCVEELPELVSMYAKSGDKFRLVGINLDRSKAAALKYVKNNNIQFTNLFDESGSVAKSFGVVGIPVKVIIDSKGKIIKKSAALKDVKKLLE